MLFANAELQETVDDELNQPLIIKVFLFQRDGAVEDDALHENDIAFSFLHYLSSYSGQS